MKCSMKGIYIIILLLWSLSVSASGSDTYLMVFWNLENFFDYTDGGTNDSDKEFSSFGNRKWTRKKFYAKCDAVAKSLLWIAEKYGRMPDVIGLAEIENRGVLVKLLNSTLLRKYDYRIVHYDSGDRRGIDVALLYRESYFSKMTSSVTVPEYNGNQLATRDILQVCVEDKMGRNINLIVNHHPSKYGGAEASAGRRAAAMQTLRQLCDSLERIGQDRIIAMGDFNDTPDGSQFSLLEGSLVNMADSLFGKGEGTIRYQGEWELIDMFLVSEDLSETSVMKIEYIPFLMTYERTYSGMKPLRTYSGPRYLGGVSDHCPIVLSLTIPSDS